MKLIELGANKESFRTIYFNPKGVTLIVGNRIKGDTKSTYNGVGKSLALYLIQFCLGSKSNKKITKQLKDWAFYLKFSIEGVEYIAERNINTQKRIKLNDKDLSISEFNEQMLNLLFEIPSELKKASFRSLISRFLRTREDEYMVYSQFVHKEQDERALLSNSILLGLNSHLVESKFLLKEEYNAINSLRLGIQKDEIFNKFFGSEGEVGLKIKELEESVDSLEKSLKNFEIAEDYKKIEVESNKISYTLKEKSNDISLIDETIKNIDKSLELKTDIGIKDVENLVSQFETEFGIDIKGKLGDVINFHTNLTSSREERLTKEKKRLKIQKAILETEHFSLSQELDKNLKYLNQFGALEDYVSVNQKLIDEKSSLLKLKSSVELIEKYKNREAEIKVKLAEDSLISEQYLQKEKTGILLRLMESYRILTGTFYDDKKGGITVLNNSGDNKLRYNIEVKIQDDSSDGINKVKLFCFDLLLLILQQKHKIKFIFHDSRLYADMDTHQRYVALKIAHELKENDFQYIATMNQDTVDILRAERTEEEFNSIIKDNVIMELNGDVPENRLLGIHLDLDY